MFLDDILGKKRTFSLKSVFSELFRFGRPETSINTDETKGRSRVAKYFNFLRKSALWEHLGHLGSARGLEAPG